MFHHHPLPTFNLLQKLIMEEQAALIMTNAPSAFTASSDGYSDASVGEGKQREMWTQSQRDSGIVKLNYLLVIIVSIYAMYIYRSRKRRVQKDEATSPAPKIGDYTADIEDGDFIMGDETGQQIFSSQAIMDAEKNRWTSSLGERRRSVDTDSVQSVYG